MGFIILTVSQLICFYISYINGQGGRVNTNPGTGPGPEDKSVVLDPWTTIETESYPLVNIAKITLLDQRTAKFEGVEYSGRGPHAHIITGVKEQGQDITKVTPVPPITTALLLPNEYNRCNRPKNYNKNTFMLRLPKEKRWTDFDFISFYCAYYHMNFGFVNFPADKSKLEKLPQCPETTDSPDCGTTEEYKKCVNDWRDCKEQSNRVIENFYHPRAYFPKFDPMLDITISSTKVTLVDQITMMIEGITYKNKEEKAHLVVGKTPDDDYYGESRISITEDVILEHSKGCGPFGTNIEKMILKLPTGKTWRSFHALFLYKIAARINLGFIEIPRNLRLVPPADSKPGMYCSNMELYLKCLSKEKKCYNAPDCPPCVCTIIERSYTKKICGCDKNTYENQCYFKCAHRCKHIKAKRCAACDEKSNMNQTECLKWLEISGVLENLE